MNTAETRSSSKSNVVMLPNTTAHDELASNIEEHAQLIRDARKAENDQAKVEAIWQKIKRLADNTLAELEFNKLPAKTKARLALWHSVQTNQGIQPALQDLFKSEISYHRQMRLAKRVKINALEKRIQTVQSKSAGETALLLKFLATLAHNGRAIKKNYLADVLGDFAYGLHHADRPVFLDSGNRSPAHAHHQNAERHA